MIKRRVGQKITEEGKMMALCHASKKMAQYENSISEWFLNKCFSVHAH